MILIDKREILLYIIEDIKMSEKNSTLKPKRGQLVILQFQTDDYGIQLFICLGWTGSGVLLREIQGSEPVDNGELHFENWENPLKDRSYVYTTIPMPESIIEAWAKVLPKTITLPDSAKESWDEMFPMPETITPVSEMETT